ncbi:MAG: hypothetical protein IJ527_06250 [Prevotella sp.]|nr:hypothetical protein [Prevotella sp.]
MIDNVVKEITKLLMRDRGMAMREALDLVYNSQFYEKLEDLDTGLYYQSPLYNYEFLKHEIIYGKIA